MAQNTNKTMGYVKGQPTEYVHGHNMRGKRYTSAQLVNRTADKSHRWKGGTRHYYDGKYILTYVARDDPMFVMARGGTTCVMEHRLVMARHLGRPLTKDETVHHKNGVANDNRLENLELWSSRHPKGQRVTDLLDWAHEIISLYEGLDEV